ncbi:hypothetical protein PP742_gp34 [Alcaligenes phage vB_Af_QDWS595]|uniref:Uncharacterized protein n=1 Tax=Alcaligenes phage vB_Af_QDWS595 TaxID=2877946 RepID=A0AAE9C0H6_9CAUD|nr:hypothetical protein PP742_gp34 [Alcaligenes phage vB_Af_QDWS595]UCR75518.1 hypothetical protein vBAfaPQDWS595_34 [Alcaligenes phage vB_Af_QDWS595]
MAISQKNTADYVPKTKLIQEIAESICRFKAPKTEDLVSIYTGHFLEAQTVSFRYKERVHRFSIGVAPTKEQSKCTRLVDSQHVAMDLYLEQELDYKTHVEKAKSTLSRWALQATDNYQSLRNYLPDGILQFASVNLSNFQRTIPFEDLHPEPREDLKELFQRQDDELYALMAMRLIRGNT